MAQEICLRPAARLPLVLRWGEPFEPLPLQSVRGEVLPERFDTAIPPWLPTGPEHQPFDFCVHVRRLCDDITRRCPELEHVRASQILFGITQSRNGRAHGLQARLTPMRFHGGGITRRFRGIEYQVQRVIVAGQEILYLMTFCVPRFLNQPFEDKFVTLFHELYHIGPQFDGDLRRHAGRCSVHTHSQRAYDERMAQLARAYLGSGPDPDLHAFLRLSHAQLLQRHGAVMGVNVPRPKLVPLIEESVPCPVS